MVLQVGIRLVADRAFVVGFPARDLIDDLLLLPIVVYLGLELLVEVSLSSVDRI